MIENQIRMKYITVWLALVCLAIPGWSQKSRIYTEDYQHFKRGKELYDKGLYGLSMREFQKMLDELPPVQTTESVVIKTEAELYLAQAAVRMDLPEGEKLILEFIRKYQPDPVADQAMYEIANYYFDAKKYDEAITFYSMLNSSSISGEKRSEVRFKEGYSLFINRDFAGATKRFDQIKDLKNDYYYPTHYYLGMCQFYQGQYQPAIANFEIAAQSPIYKSLVPYYVCQIRFAEKDYPGVIQYGEQALQSPGNQKYAAEIHQMVGQAYFEQKQYNLALPHLEYYDSKRRSMRPEDFYQLGYTQYVNEKYPAAIESFKNITGIQSDLGQNASFYLADCYLKTGDKKSARSSFYEASQLDFDPVMQEDALFNYARLSAELNYDREAIQALTSFPKDSKYYLESQSIMTDVFLRTRDYDRAIAIIEQLPEKTPQIREAYQQVTFLRGLQLMGEDQLFEAQEMFEKSLASPIDVSIQAQCLYWEAEIAYRQNDFSKSDLQLNKYFTVAKSTGNLPPEASPAIAYYLQGYNAFKRNAYNQALNSFEKSIGGIKQDQVRYDNDQEYLSTRILSDAMMRAGDCYFKQNQYSSALKNYNAAIQNHHAGYQYAMFQKAIIQGLTNDQKGKISTLRELIEKNSGSEYTDDALLELGSTYQENNMLELAKTPLQTLVKDYANKSNLVNEGLLKLGLIFYNENNYNVALNYYKDVFNHNPTPKESQEALSAIEEIYVEDLGKPDEYFAFLEKVPGYKVDNYTRDSINFRAADLNYENGQYQKAIDGYTAYLSKYPKGAYALPAYYRRAESYSLLKKYSEALTDYEVVIKRGASDYYENALYKAALIAYNNEQAFQKALDYYNLLEQVTSAEERKLEAQVGALQCAYRLNRPNEVYRLGDQVVKNPRTSQVQQATAYFFMGKVAFDQSNYDKALEGFNQAIKLNDNLQAAESRYLIAQIYFNKNEYDLSATLAEQGIKDNSAYPTWTAKCGILLADVKTIKKEYHIAEAILQQIIDNYPDLPEIVQEASDKLKKVKALRAANNRIDSGAKKNTLEIEGQNN